MKRLLFFGLSFLFLFFSGCDGCVEKSPSKPIQKKKLVVQQQAPQPQASIKDISVKSKVWPYLSDDQQEEEIADNITANNFILVFDGSGSMRDTDCAGGRQKIDVAKEAVVEWSKFLPQDANLGLVAFHNNGWSHGPLAAGQRENFINTVQDVIAGDKTPLTEALAKAFTNLTKQGRRQLGYGEYTIVVVTDGIANSAKLLAGMINKILSKSPINIYTIGFCIGKNHSLNQPGLTEYKAADNPVQLRQGLKEVLAESETFDDSDFN